ncbi:MAG TPA: Fic family protein, partial [Methanobacterium sp.]
MFQPNFQYTSKMVNTLVEITSARDMIVNSYIIPKLELSLRRDTLIKSAHSSTAIEGNPLNLDEVDRLLQGQRVVALEKSKQEVLNYLDVLRNIGDYQEDDKITEQVILKLHRDVTKKTLDDPSNEGRYRDVQVYVVNRLKEIIFTPPPPYEISKQMKNFIEWLETTEAVNIHPVIAAGISHYEFVRIHPFVDGNGRTARALVTLIL